MTIREAAIKAVKVQQKMGRFHLHDALGRVAEDDAENEIRLAEIERLTEELKLWNDTRKWLEKLKD